MSVKIGIRHEDKYALERRTPLTPNHIKELVDTYNIGFAVQSSETRIFKDQEYKTAGAEISKCLSQCNIIMGVKEIPVDFFEEEKTYIFFSHVIKGQPYNMPMLKKMMELRCNLIDYEKVADDNDKRLIFFGRFAGLAGMINSLWSMGERLKVQGYENNPFRKIKQSYHYNTLEEAKQEIATVGKEIKENGLPKELSPFTIGFTGYGNVSNGAMEIAHLLPVQKITPRELLVLKQNGAYSDKLIYTVVFKENHISKHANATIPFDLQEFYNHPDRYTGNFEQYIPHITVLMNCMYWDDRYPRLFTREFAKKMFESGHPKTEVIGDITCDPEGSIEFTHKPTTIEEPVFVYNPLTEKATMGFDGEGILVMAVDILPSELPRDSSEAFGNALVPFIKPIADADFSADFNTLQLPLPIKKALILHKGKLTQDYKYIQQYL
jgi:alanine dehydrogenase